MNPYSIPPFPNGIFAAYGNNYVIERQGSIANTQTPKGETISSAVGGIYVSNLLANDVRIGSHRLVVL